MSSLKRPKNLRSETITYKGNKKEVEIDDSRQVVTDEKLQLL